MHASAVEFDGSQSSRMCSAFESTLGPTHTFRSGLRTLNGPTRGNIYTQIFEARLLQRRPFSSPLNTCQASRVSIEQSAH